MNGILSAVMNSNFSIAVSSILVGFKTGCVLYRHKNDYNGSVELNLWRIINNLCGYKILSVPGINKYNLLIAELDADV